MRRPPDSTPSTTDWSNFAMQHKRIQPPLRPSTQDVSNFRQSIRGRDGAVLLLGVTPDLACLGETLIAADGSARMIKEVWPGDDKRRRAILTDWLTLPIPSSSIDAVVGDGSLNAVAGGISALLLEVRRVLAPGGVAAFRTFCSPEDPESLGDIGDDVRGGWPGNFHALKWRIAMSIASQNNAYNVSVKEILSAFETIFPDRDELRDVTGWSAADISTIEYYESVAYSIWFPPESRLRDVARACSFSVEVTQSSGYPLASRCPMIVLSAAD